MNGGVWPFNSRRLQRVGPPAGLLAQWWLITFDSLGYRLPPLLGLPISILLTTLIGVGLFTRWMQPGAARRRRVGGWGVGAVSVLAVVLYSLYIVAIVIVGDGAGLNIKTIFFLSSVMFCSPFLLVNIAYNWTERGRPVEYDEVAS